MPKQYIVAGGGLAGLISAVSLAQKGNPVTLYEQTRHVGGRATTDHEDSFALNRGPHALYRKGPLFNLLTEWQIPFSGNVPKLTSGAYLVDGTDKFAFPSDTSHLLLTGALSVGERLAAGKAMQLMTTEQPPENLTMHAWLDDNVRSPRVRLLVQALIRLTTFCVDLQYLSARAAIDQFQFGAKNSVLYLDKGWQSLVDGLTSKAESAGVKICTGVAVEHVESGAVHLSNGQRVDCDGAILAVPPDAVERLTGKKLPTLRPIRMACLDLGFRSIPSKWGCFGLGLDQPFYLSMHSLFANLAPEGCSLVQVGKYLAPEDDGTREELENFAELILPGWRNHATTTRFLPNMVVTHAVPSVAGRPGVDALGMPGVAIAGDWVGKQAMLSDAAASSALESAALVSAPANALYATR